METRDKIVSLESGILKVALWKQAGLRIVFTNGCFDILHLGHIDYLEKARLEGDRLILGLNTDASIRKIKGPGRPIVNENARARVLASMYFVDLIVPFDEETPLMLIESLNPDILVKGKDYDIKNIVGADFVLKNGGSVRTIDLVEGYSTSAIIEKIKKQKI